MVGYSIAIPRSGEILHAEQCERFARLCAERLTRATEPRVRERLQREHRDWLELAARRACERSARVIERLREFRRPAPSD